MAKKIITTYTCDRCPRDIEGEPTPGRTITVILGDHEFALEDMHDKCRDRAEALLKDLLLDHYVPPEDAEGCDNDDQADEPPTEPEPASKPDPKPAAKPKAPKKKTPEPVYAFGIGDLVEHTDSNGDHHRGSVLSRFPRADGKSPAYEVKFDDLGTMALSEAELVEAGTGAPPVDDDGDDNDGAPQTSGDPLDDTVGEMPPAPDASDDEKPETMATTPNPADLPPPGGQGGMPPF